MQKINREIIEKTIEKICKMTVKKRKKLLQTVTIKTISKIEFH